MGAGGLIYLCHVEQTHGSVVGGLLGWGVVFGWLGGMGVVACSGVLRFRAISFSTFSVGSNLGVRVIGWVR